MKKDARAYKGLTIFYVTEERAMATGISDGWPAIIPAPHTSNRRLKRLSPAECKKIMESGI